MRRIFILGLLFLLMYALQFLQVEVEAPFHPKTLATLGFVLLAAYTLGELASTAGLPKITGYIITGIVFGPYVVNLFSIGVVDDLKGINNLAIGLIALTAGGELKLSGLRSVAKSLTFIVLIKGFLILVAITATVFAIKPLIPFLADKNTPLVLAVGSIFGILAVGTSPAATIAVINETGSRGRLTDTTLGAAVVKDVVMVILLAVAISLSNLFSTPGATFENKVFMHVGEELLFSIIAGVVLGLVIIGYIKFIHAEMWLFIVGVIFFATAIAELLHLEALLMFITAGFVVQNFSKFGDRLIHPIEAVALPVYVVFFSIAGAGLDLSAFQQVGVVAAILVAVRIVAIYFGTRFATSLANEPLPIKKNAWLSFIAQAGVVLGLSIIVENNVPVLGAEIKTVVLGTIALNLLIGPITFKVALSNVGETKERQAQRAAEATPVGAPETGVSESVAEIKIPVEIRYPAPDFSSPALNQAAHKVRENLIKLQREFDETFIKPQTAELLGFIAGIRDQFTQAVERMENAVSHYSKAGSDGVIHILRENRVSYSRWLMGEIMAFASNDETVRRLQNAFKQLFNTMASLCEAADASIEVVQEPGLFAPSPRDSLYVKARKTLKRWRKKINALFGSGAEMNRIVYFRRLAKYHFAGTLPMRMPSVANLLGAQPLFMLKKCRILYNLIDEGYGALISFLEGKNESAVDINECLNAVKQIQRGLNEEFHHVLADIERYRSDCNKRLGWVWSQIYGEFLHDLEIAGTFELPRTKFRFSRIYETCERAKNNIAKAFEIWQKYGKGFAGAHAQHAEVVILKDNVSRAVDETVYRISKNVVEKLAAGVLAVKSKCEASHQHLEHEFACGDSFLRLRDEIVSQQKTMVQFIQKDALRRLNRLRTSRELNSLIDVMLQRFADLADEMPKEYLIVDEEDIPTGREEGVTPPDIKLEVVPLQEITRSYLETEIARELADINRMTIEEVDEAIQAVTDVYKIIKYNLDAAAEALPTEESASSQPEAMARPKELALGSLQRAMAKLDDCVEKVHQLEQQAYRQIETQVEDKLEKIDQVILRQSVLLTKAHLKQKEVATLGHFYWKQLWKWLSTNYQIIARRLVHRYRPFAEEKIKDIRTTFGLQKLSQAEILSIQDRAKLDKAVLDKLPFIYQKLFDITPLETSDFLIARDEELEIIKTAKRRWQQGMHCSVAVVGELGSGKTSFINVSTKEIFRDCRVYKKNFMQVVTGETELITQLAELLELPEAASFEALAAEIEQVTESTVIVLEDAHKLYLRTLGGFEALRKLLLLVASTSNKVLWIFSMREFAWRYLDNVLNISDYFTFVINTENILRDEIERVILSRHKVSGFELRFLPDPVMKQKRKYRYATEEERQQILRKEYFDQLRKATEGNILAAMFYWLQSLGEVRDEVLEVKPLQRLELDFLQDMPVDKLLTLAMIIHHGSLSAEEHVLIFGKDLGSSLATLTYLTNINLLIKEVTEDGKARFAASRIIYKPVANELRALNILH